MSVSVSWCCHSKVLPTEGLKTAEISCLTFLEARVPTSRHWQGRAPSEGSREDPSCFCVASGGGPHLRPAGTSLQSQVASPCYLFLFF